MSCPPTVSSFLRLSNMLWADHDMPDLQTAHHWLFCRVHAITKLLNAFTTMFVSFLLQRFIMTKRKEVCCKSCLITSFPSSLCGAPKTPSLFPLLGYIHHSGIQTISNTFHR